MSEENQFSIGKERCKKLAKLIDKGVKTGIVDPFDDGAWKFAVQFVDEKVSPLVPVELQDEFLESLDAFIDGNLNAVRENFILIIRELVADFVEMILRRHIPELPATENNNEIIVSAVGGGPDEERPGQ